MYRAMFAFLLILIIDVPYDDLWYGFIYFLFLMFMFITGAKDWLKEVEENELRETDRDN